MLRYIDGLPVFDRRNLVLLLFMPKAKFVIFNISVVVVVLRRTQTWSWLWQVYQAAEKTMPLCAS